MLRKVWLERAECLCRKNAVCPVYCPLHRTQNQRNSQLKEVRSEWNSSRFFFGKNKVMVVAFGKSPEDEYKENLHLVSENITGNCGLFFTDEPEDKVINFFQTFRETDFARSGAPSTQTITLPAGPLTQFAHPMEPHLRKLGMPTSLKNGIIQLETDFNVCKEGESITPEQGKILKLLGVKMSEFTFDLACVYSAGKFKKLEEQ